MILGLNKPVLSFAIAVVTAGCSPIFASEPIVPAAFNRDIRPILSDNCFHCHGPDEAQRKADLRLDTEAGAFAALPSGGHAIIPGNISESELVRRVMTEDDDLRMPPPDSNRKLTPAQKALLVRPV
ncbi:MAG: hypothetical protein IAF58_19230 [Leptolyngbya sp.]|nr:hypothetical protein [Candidatus Melainabacteria bacterium]